MKKICFLLFFFLNYWLTQFAVAQDLVLSVLPDSAISLRNNLQLLTDETKIITWKEAYQLKEKNVFQPFEKAEFKGMLERGKYAYWFYFSINFLDTTSQRVIIKNFGGGRNTIHVFRDSILKDSFLIHSSVSITKRMSPNLAYQKYDIPITLQPGVNEFFIRKVQFPTFHPKHVRPILMLSLIHISEPTRPY